MKKTLTNLATTSTNLLTGLFRAPAIFAAVFAVLICFFAAAQSNAATFTVTTIGDSGAGSLRQAVLDANGVNSNDVIVFAIPSGSCSGAGVCTITLTTTEITVANNGTLTIQGTGANRLTISGGIGTNRIFYSNAATFTLSGATLTNGNGAGASPNGRGGAIYANGGTLVLRGVNVTGNTASSGGFGGGVVFDGGTNHQITNSTFSGNNGLVDCGGFWVGVATSLTMTNTTVSGNMATQPNGGFCSDGTLTVRNSTIADNIGGGFSMGGGTVNIGNSIVAGNTGSFANFAIFGGTLTSAGYNLIGNNANATTQFPAGNPNGSNDIVGTSGVPINPLLDALGNYGGTVPTRRLQTGSPAIDKGSAVAGVFSDGRGVIRPFDNPLTANAASGNGADIGAFELQSSIVRDWGQNDFGQLGLGDLTNKTVPTAFSGFNNITQFGGNTNHSVALRSDGTVVTAGDDQYGQLGDGTIGGGNRTTFAAVTVGGNVVNITSVSGGVWFSLAVKSDGTVWAWGRNTNGQLGNGTNADSATPVQVGAGIAGFDGRVIAVSGGDSHSLALTDDGKVWAWGWNAFSQLGTGTGDVNVPNQVRVSSGGAQLSGIIQIGAGDFHNIALTTSGTVLAWGSGGSGEIGNGGGSVVAFPTQTTNTLMGTVVQISAGAYFNVAVNTAGDVYAWGRGDFGMIGDNNTANALVPRKTSTVSNVVRIEAHGAFHTLARQRDGTMFVWGANFNGPIGNGTTTQQNTPLNISAVAGTGGNLGTNIAVFGTGRQNSFASTLPEITTPAGASTLRGDNFSVAFPASTVAGTTQIRAFNPTATGLTVPTGYTIEANSTGYDFTTTATFPGTATVCLKVPNVISLAAFNMLNILHDDNGDGTLDIAASTRDYQRREVCRATTSFSPFVLAQALVPLAATVSVSGRVSVNGAGLRNAVVQLTDSQGNTRTARTGSFGYYNFDEVEAGQTYIVAVISKRFQFNSQVVSVSEDLANLDFFPIE